MGDVDVVPSLFPLLLAPFVPGNDCSSASDMEAEFSPIPELQAVEIGLTLEQ